MSALPRVVVVGCGALGSHVALLLRNEASLVLVDHDRVEAKNVLSQHHPKASIGKNKAVALAAHLMFFGVKPAAIPNALTQVNAYAVLGDADLVVDCTDSAEARTLMHKHCQLHGYPLLHAALAAGGDYGQVTWDTEGYRADANDGGAATCHAGEHLPHAALVAAYAARAAQAFLRDGKRVGYAVSAAGAVPL